MKPTRAIKARPCSLQWLPDPAFSMRIDSQAWNDAVNLHKLSMQQAAAAADALLYQNTGKFQKIYNATNVALPLK